MLWCYTDYDPANWETPPLDLAVHERSFGLWHADGSPKPSVAAVTALTETDRVDSADDYEWIDIEPDEFFLHPGTTSRVSTFAIESAQKPRLTANNGRPLPPRLPKGDRTESSAG